MCENVVEVVFDLSWDSFHWVIGSLPYTLTTLRLIFDYEEEAAVIKSELEILGRSLVGVGYPSLREITIDPETKPPKEHRDVLEKFHSEISTSIGVKLVLIGPKHQEIM